MTMVPAKTQCPTSWTREYYGYLMAERENGVQFTQSSYTCIDVTPDTVPVEARDTAGTHFTYMSLLHAMMVFHVHNIWPTECCPVLSAPSSYS